MKTVKFFDHEIGNIFEKEFKDEEEAQNAVDNYRWGDAEIFKKDEQDEIDRDCDPATHIPVFKNV